MKTMGEPIRLNKLIASKGIASRREADRLIQEGDVTVNGKLITEPGTRVDADDVHIKVKGRLLPRGAPPPTYLLLNKPVGVVTTDDDPEGRVTVQSLLQDVPTRVEPVGRLDFHTEGLLLLTNDGDLAFRLTHPRFQVPKTYLVKVTGVFTDKKIGALERGIPLPDGRTAPAQTQVVEAREKNTWVQVTIHEGRNRLVRRMMEFLGHKVLKLKRVAFAGLTTAGVEPGRWRMLTEAEVSRLKSIARGEISAEAPRFDPFPKGSSPSPHPLPSPPLARPPVRGRATTRPPEGEARPRKPTSGPRPGPRSVEGPVRPPKKTAHAEEAPPRRRVKRGTGEGH